MSAHDGGQAFPQTVHRSERGFDWVESVDGMTLRDYFAAKAMQGLIAAFSDEDARMFTVANAEQDGVTPKARVAAASYEYADAMLAARGAA